MLLSIWITFPVRPYFAARAVQAAVVPGRT